jgi:hypothetical protein
MSSKKIFIMALFFYVFISPFFYHPDIKTIFYQSQFLSKGVINIYSFFVENPDKGFLGSFVYPPLAYFLFGILFVPVKLIAGSGFTNWLAMGNDAVWVDSIFRYIFAMKLPSLLALFCTGHLLAKLTDSEIKRKKLLLFWFFNPVSIYAVGFMGQIDAIAVLFTTLSLYFAFRKPYFSSFLLGIGALTKSYPLILLPYFSLLASKNWKQQAKLFIVGFLTYLIGVSFFLKTPSFYENTFVSGLSQRIFQMGIGIGFEESILIIPFVLLISLFLLKKKDSGLLIKLNNYYFFILTLIVVASHFHPQWVVWSIPYLAYGLFEDTGKMKEGMILPIILYFMGFLGTVILFNDKFLTWGLISPIDNAVLFLPTLQQLLIKYVDTSLIQNLFHTLMAASGLFIGVKLINEKNNL